MREPISNALEFGRAVRLTRKERGLSQRDLAGRCGCSQRFISELERGKETAELGKAILVLSSLGISLSAISVDAGGNAREAITATADRVAAKLSEKKATVSLADYL